MLNWLDSWFVNPAKDIIRDVLNLIYGVVRGLYSWAQSTFNLAWQGLDDLWHGIDNLYHALSDLGTAIYRILDDIYHTVVPYLENFINYVLHWADAAINAVQRALYDVIDTVYHWAQSAIDAVTKWVIAEIWTPLWGSLTSAWHWLTHEGATLWYYITHFDALAEALFWFLVSKLEKYAWDAGRALGRFFISLIIHNAVQFATLIEDIVDAIL